MIITFCGHKDVIYKEEDRKRLKNILSEILQKTPNAVFYLGDYGNFDGICNHILKEIQTKKYPGLRRIFITPYRDIEYAHFAYAKEIYDEILYPFSEKIMRRYAISKRNQWMVDKSDLVIAHVDHDWGGAAKTLEYAIRKKKSYINLGEL